MFYETRAGMSDMPVFFIHGNLAANIWWDRLLDHLPQDGQAPFILAEWKGCGRAQPAKTESELHPRALATEFLQWLEKNGHQKVYLVGHSAGGMIAQQMMILEPERIEKSVLISSVGMKGLHLLKDSIDKFEMLQRDRKFLEITLAMTIHKGDRQLLEVCPNFFELVEQARKVDHLNWTGVLRQFSDLDLSHSLSPLDIPTMIIHGVHDQVIPISEAREMAQVIKGSKLIEMPENGHNPFVESPQQVAALLREFLQV